MAHYFISYSREDRAFIQNLIADLQKAGITVYIDQIGLKAGTHDWEQALRDAIRESDAVFLAASPNSRRSPFVRDELAIARMENKAIYPLWVGGEEWADCIPMGLGYTQFVDLRHNYKQALQTLITTLRDEEQPAVVVTSTPPSSSPLTEPRNPYKGLRAFRAEDRADFFGREVLIAELVEAMRPQPKKPNFLAVIGPSGSGKSSVVMAGLLPALQEEASPKSNQWLYLDPIVPGNYPLENLTIALARVINKAQADIRKDLESPPKRGLHLLAKQLTGSTHERVVLYIDQFEELFTLTTDEHERQQFIDLLTTATTEPDSVVSVVVSLRADFYDRPLQYAELGNLIKSQQVVVLPLSLADLHDVVQKPAELPDVRVTFEDELITELVFAVRDQIGALPLLQFALDQLFEKRDGRSLTRAAYQAMGGVQGALAQHAEQTYLNLATEEHRQLARVLFLRLIEPGATEQDTTRRRAAQNELTLVDTKQTQLLQAVAATFIQARLLVSNQAQGITTLEVSHEALIREWRRLGEWLHGAREDLRLQGQVRDDVAEWLRRSKAEDLLYRGAILDEAEAWLKRSIPSADEVRFIEISRQIQAQRLAEQAKIARRVRMFQQATALLFIVFILAVGAIIVALNTANTAQQDKKVAQNLQEEVEQQATLFSAQQGRYQTQLPGVSIIPTRANTLEPAQFFATETQISKLGAWEPLSQEFDGVEMVQVPAGCFIMGSMANADEQPPHEICFAKSFWIDRYEVTNAQFRQFGGAAENEPAWTGDNLPRESITWGEAIGFCEQKRHARLPTEAEWEYAARGPNSLIYLWGNDPPGANFFDYSGFQPSPVGTSPNGKSWVGAYDMSGNVAEWVSSRYQEYPYNTTDGRENEIDYRNRRIIRGGSFRDLTIIRPATRNGYAPFNLSDFIGFRCVRSE